MSEQELNAIAGRYMVEIRSLKREIGGLAAWLASYVEATRAATFDIGKLVRETGGMTAAGTAALAKMAECPAELVRARVEELQVKRASLAEKERLLAGM